MTNETASGNTKAETSTPEARRPRIYVACLAAYNNAILHGRWIEATTPEDIQNQVRDMLAASPEPSAEEWAIHDHEGFQGCDLSEYASFESVCDLADFIEEHGELGAKIYEYFGGDLSDARAAFDDYAGEYASKAEFAEQLFEETGAEIPTNLQYYIDWKSLARDMELNGEIMSVELSFEEVHVFWTR